MRWFKFKKAFMEFITDNLEIIEWFTLGAVLGSVSTHIYIGYQ